MTKALAFDEHRRLPRELIRRGGEFPNFIRREIIEGKYVPEPVRKVEIPKPNGKGTRTLGIPTVMDRMIQQALSQKLTPIFDPTFSSWSFGFRPGRSVHDAVRAAQEHMSAGHRWVVDQVLGRLKMQL